MEDDFKITESKSDIVLSIGDWPKNIHFVHNGVVMLAITPEGFYVRGEKVEKDADEAKRVYEAFEVWGRSIGFLR